MSDFPEIPVADSHDKFADLLVERYKGQVTAWVAREAADSAEQKAQADADRTASEANHAAEIADSKARNDAAIALTAAGEAADSALEKAEFDVEYELLKASHAAFVEVAKGSIDRSRATGQFVQTAATAVAALYTGILAFMAIGAAKTLPVRGLIPVTFLSLAIALSVGYLAFIGRAGKVEGVTGASDRRSLQWARTAMFIRYVNQTVLTRAWLIRGSVISLALGALFLPIGLIDVQDSWAWGIAIVLIVALVIFMVISYLFDRRSDPT